MRRDLSTHAHAREAQTQPNQERVSRRPGLAGAALAVAVLVATLAACGSPDGSRVDDRGPAGPIRVDEIDLSSGAAVLRAPLSPRTRPLVVAAGTRLLVMGGELGLERSAAPDAQGGGELRAPNATDGAWFDPADGAWHAVAPMPDGLGLFAPAGVWTGREVVVAGTGCRLGTYDGDDPEGPDCDPGGFRVLRYTPDGAAGSWTVLPTGALPDALAGAVRQAFALAGLGWTGRYAAFAGHLPGARYGTWTVLLVDPRHGVARWVDTPARTDRVCVAGRQVIAVRTGQIDDAGGVGQGSGAGEPIRTWVLDEEKGVWTSPAERPKTVGGADLFTESVSCGPGALVYAPVSPPPVGYGPDALAWDPSRRGWAALPGLPPVGHPGTPLVARHDQALVLWFANGPLLTLDEGAARWEQRSAPPLRPVRLMVLGDLLAVEGGDTATDGPPTIGLLDLDRYRAAVPAG